MSEIWKPVVGYESLYEVSELETLRARVKALEAELNETWVDDKDTVWTRPTAWAYAQVCRVKDEQKARLRTMEEALRGLYDEQNGAPLETRKVQWHMAMEAARFCLQHAQQAVENKPVK